MRKRKIVVLGSTGFIGGALVKALSGSDKKYRVLGFSSKQCNLLSWRSARGALRGLRSEDVVVFCSAISRLRENSYRAMTQNIQMAYHLAEVLRERPVAQVVFLSTIDVYGCKKRRTLKNKDIISEHSSLHPDDPYSLSKVASEMLLQQQAEKLKVPLVILRLPGVYGPGDGGRSLVSTLIHQAEKFRKISVHGSGRILRNYVFIDDVVQAVFNVIEKKVSGVLNIVSPRSYTILEIAKMVRLVLNVKVPVECQKKGFAEGLRTRSIVCANLHLRKVLPGLKMHDLNEGIRQYAGRSHNKNY